MSNVWALGSNCTDQSHTVSRFKGLLCESWLSLPCQNKHRSQCLHEGLTRADSAEAGSRMAQLACPETSAAPHVKAAAGGGRSPMALGGEEAGHVIPRTCAGHCAAHAHRTLMRSLLVFQFTFGEMEAWKTK